jgi:hypothetical protein
VHDRDGPLDRGTALIRERERILLVDAPLSPIRTGRQPARSDRTVVWIKNQMCN